MGFVRHQLQGVNEHGRPVKKTKLSHPHSYDGFVQWRGAPNDQANATVWTDRLWQWNADKYRDLCIKHFGDMGQMWSGRDPVQIEAFLRDWHGDQTLKLILVMEYCNQSSGHPTWRLDYRKGK